MDVAVRCAIFLSGKFCRLSISKQAAPKLFHALLFLAEALHTGNRTLRYLTLFKSYECLTEDRRAEFGAIRPALSHPGHLLTRPSTIAALELMFGARTNNLRNSRHLRIYFRQFARLLVENDELIDDAIRANLPLWNRQPPR